MSFNLTDLIKDQINDQVLSLLGTILDGATEQNSAAIDSAIPGLLGGLMNSGSSTIGGNALLGAINDQDDNILENFGELLSSNKQSALMNAGSNILGSQLGASGLGSLISAVAGFSGLSKGSAKSLLGLLTPIVLSLLKRKLLSGDGLNLNSLTSLFNSQKKHIAASTPEGFQQQLDNYGFTNNIASNAKDLSQTIIIENPSLLNKLFPIALIFATILLAYNLFFKTGIEAPVLETSTSSAERVNIERQISGVMGNVTRSLDRITDAQSAEAAIPKLEEASSKLGNIASILHKLPASIHQPASSMVVKELPKITSMLDKATTIPGVDPVLKPISDNLLAKLALFQK